MMVPLVTGAEVAFWLLAPVMILGALGMILSASRCTPRSAWPR